LFFHGPLKRDAARNFWINFFEAAKASLAFENYNGRFLPFLPPEPQTSL
jgi:hypothetical protein